MAGRVWCQPDSWLRSQESTIGLKRSARNPNEGVPGIMSTPDVVIIAGARTPFARINGNLAGRTAVELGTVAIRGALEKAGVSPDDVDAVIMGQVLQAGAGQNPAKQSAVAAGIP